MLIIDYKCLSIYKNNNKPTLAIWPNISKTTTRAANSTSASKQLHLLDGRPNNARALSILRIPEPTRFRIPEVPDLTFCLAIIRSWPQSVYKQSNNKLKPYSDKGAAFSTARHAHASSSSLKPARQIHRGYTTITSNANCLLHYSTALSLNRRKSLSNKGFHVYGFMFGQ